MKKTMEKLNKHLFPLLVVALLLVGSCLPIRVNAAYDPSKPIDYTQLDYSVKYGTEYNQVSVSIPADYFYHQVSTGAGTFSQVGGEMFDFDFLPGHECDLGEFPAGYRGLLLENIPVGSSLQFKFRVDLNAPVDPDWIPTFLKRSVYQDSNGGWLGSYSTSEIPGSLDQTYILEYVIEEKANAYAFVPSLAINDWGSYAMSDTTVTVVMEDVRLVMDISSDYWSKWQAGQNGKLLNDMVNGTDEQNAIVNDTVQGMEQAGNKLDGLGDQLNSVEKPNVDNMDVSADKLLGGMAATTMLTAPVLEIWKNPVALSILTVVVTIVLISWVFFGKK